jgi:hypothetical protein
LAGPTGLEPATSGVTGRRAKPTLEALREGKDENAGVMRRDPAIFETLPGE